MLPQGACFHFTCLFCNKALTVKTEKNLQKTTLKGSSYKMPNVKTIFWPIYTLSIIIQKYKNRFFFKNIKIGFFQVGSVSCERVKFRFSMCSDNNYRHFTPEVRAKVLLLK